MQYGFVHGKKTLAAFLDVKSAYDRADHGMLLSMLIKKRCLVGVFRYIKNWLSDRTVRVSKKYERDCTGVIRRGLPQGSVLSPILYNVYTCEIADGINDNEIVILQFADDIGMYVQSSHGGTSNVERLESALKIVIKNLKRIGLGLAVEKTEIIQFSRLYKSRTVEDERVSVRVGSAVIEEKEYVRFLGIYFDRRCMFREHAKRVVATARNRLNMLRYIAHVDKG